ncbi:hypothetical protein DDQ41_28870 [Streptomyces spongiicola]|uniref:JmjC domain-containing protein n=1 Tax=Streptomyces spongiicola TaxID=1690221 RepID=A0ABN5KRD0_9ACTN|nr:hypothetical protein [Streptomyces spongiicola]AWK12265.1 hypothetical protein DDQ41_28870 [Streptomyces spongiicola]
MRRPAIAPSREPAAVSGVRWHLPEVTPGRVRRVLDRAFAASARSAAVPRTKLFVRGEPEERPGAWRGKRPAEGAAHDVFAWAGAAQTHDRTLFRALVTGLEPWFARRGLPQGRVEAEVFYGRYGETPGGIHREACSNLHLVVEGRKTMDFWAGDAWLPPETPVREDRDPESGAQEQYLSGLAPRDHRHRAESLTAAPGQGFAWEAGTWHVGRSEGGPSLALNVASYGRGAACPGPVLRSWSDRFAGEVPGDWLEDYRCHTASDGTAADMLATLSALGMRPPRPARTGGPLAGPARLRAPVLWHGDGGVLRIAALGASVRVPDRVEVRDWLARGLRCPRAGLDVPAGCRQVAGWLAERGALTVGRGT